MGRVKFVREFGGFTLSSTEADAGEINASPNSTTSAFAGYERIEATDYKLVVRSLQKQITLEGTVPFVEVDLVVFRTFGAFTSGEVSATVTWDYEPIR